MGEGQGRSANGNGGKKQEDGEPSEAEASYFDPMGFFSSIGPSSKFARTFPDRSTEPLLAGRPRKWPHAPEEGEEA